VATAIDFPSPIQPQLPRCCPLVPLLSLQGFDAERVVRGSHSSPMQFQSHADACNPSHLQGIIFDSGPAKMQDDMASK